ncbi:MAG TPA: hypothetical protein VM537_13340 [Anaerolineae bacterium]|nr:hypothetical protein [Anaerolineae bacterium]
MKYIVVILIVALALGAAACSELENETPKPEPVQAQAFLDTYEIGEEVDPDNVESDAIHHGAVDARAENIEGTAKVVVLFIFEDGSMAGMAFSVTSADSGILYKMLAYENGDDFESATY